MANRRTAMIYLIKHTSKWLNVFNPWKFSLVRWIHSLLVWANMWRLMASTKVATKHVQYTPSPNFTSIPWTNLTHDELILITFHVMIPRTLGFSIDSAVGKSIIQLYWLTSMLILITSSLLVSDDFNLNNLHKWITHFCNYFDYYNSLMSP